MLWHRYQLGGAFVPGLNIWASRNGMALHWLSPYWRRTWSVYLRWAWPSPALHVYCVPRSCIDQC